MAYYSLMMQYGKENVDINDVNDEINALLQKNKKSLFISENLKCTSENLNENLTTLNEELLVLGFDSITENPENQTVALCNVMWELITRLRNLEFKRQRIENDNKQLVKNNELLQKSNRKLAKELETSKNEVSTLTINNNKLKSKLEIENKDKINLKKDCDRLRMTCKSIEEKSKNDIQHIKAQMDVLKNKFRGQCGTYISTDNQIVKELREKEAIMKKKNNILTENNEKLMQEILNMKEAMISLKQKSIKAEHKTQQK